jgi:hypothetical protein
VEIMFCIIVILAAVFAMPAKADETLKYRFVAHTSWVQSETAAVPDVGNHLMGANRQVGIVFYQDGSTGTGATTGILMPASGLKG